MTASKFARLGIFMAFCVGITILNDGCKKTDSTAGPGGGGGAGTGTAGYTLNGGGFSNQAFNLGNANAAYEAGEGVTYVFATSVAGSDTLFLGVAFAGNQTGTFSWSDTAAVAITMTSPSSRRVYSGYPGSGSTTVSAYGSVGGTVSGTFSGTVIGGDIGGSTIDTVTVTSGTFSATRIQ